MTPANSWPATQGRGGCHWYFPAIWRRSKKFVDVAWTERVYWSGEGVGAGREVTESSRGPLESDGKYSNFLTLCVWWYGLP